MRAVSRSGRSRDPAAYRWTDHFKEETLDDPMRFLTEEMVEETILFGHDHPDEGGPNKFRRKHGYEGVNAVLVLALDAPVVVTGWTEIGDITAALASDRWSQDDLAKMRAFEDREHKGAWWE